MQSLTSALNGIFLGPKCMIFISEPIKVNLLTVVNVANHFPHNYAWNKHKLQTN